MASFVISTYESLFFFDQGVMLMNPKATQDDYNEVMSCVRAGYKRLKLSSLGFGLKKYLKKKLEFFLFTTNPRLLCKLKKKELR